MLPDNFDDYLKKLKAVEEEKLAKLDEEIKSDVLNITTFQHEIKKEYLAVGFANLASGMNLPKSLSLEKVSREENKKFFKKPTNAENVQKVISNELCELDDIVKSCAQSECDKIEDFVNAFNSASSAIETLKSAQLIQMKEIERLNPKLQLVLQSAQNPSEEMVKNMKESLSQGRKHYLSRARGVLGDLSDFKNNLPIPEKNHLRDIQEKLDKQKAQLDTGLKKERSVREKTQQNKEYAELISVASRKLKEYKQMKRNLDINKQRIAKK